MSFTPRLLEDHINWRSGDVAEPDRWTVNLTDSDARELDHALGVAKARSDNLLDITRDDFPLDGLVPKLAEIERELIDGRGFVRIAALDASRYSDDDLTMLYWGIGMHLGDPWPQNKYGHMMGDVTDQGKRLDDPTVRGNEIGLVGLDYHTDGSDLVGLMCLRRAKTGGLSCVANVVAIYNEMVKRGPISSRRSISHCPGISAASSRRAGRTSIPVRSSPSMTVGSSSASCRNISRRRSATRKRRASRRSSSRHSTR